MPLRFETRCLFHTFMYFLYGFGFIAEIYLVSNSIYFKLALQFFQNQVLCCVSGYKLTHGTDGRTTRLIFGGSHHEPEIGCTSWSIHRECDSAILRGID